MASSKDARSLVTASTAQGAAGNTSMVSSHEAVAAAIMLSDKTRRALGDSKYDKRKAGALEVEAIVKSLVAQQRRGGGSCEDAVRRLCMRLRSDFICSSYPDQRKGGLIAMAAVAVGLGTEVGSCLDALLEPVLKCFEDNEPRVRYFAAESMYNICKVARSYLLQPCEDRFNHVFMGLCKISADNDAEVRYGAGLLDRLLKVIVAESDAFKLDAVVPLFQRFLQNKNPFIRQLLVSWIMSLDAVPDLDLVSRLPALLNGLFDMLSDVNKSIKDAADNALRVFLQEIADSSAEKRKQELIPSTVDILLQRRLDQTRQVRLTCMVWLSKFVPWGGDALVDHFAEFLKAVVDAVSEQDDTDKGEIVALGHKLNTELREIALKSPAGQNVDEKALVGVALVGTRHSNLMVRETCLSWLSLLLDTVPTRMTPALTDELLPSLVERLEDEADDVVSLALEAMGRIARNSGSCDRILEDILTKFERDRRLLEERGAFIVRKLCLLLRPRTVYLVLSRILDSWREEKDLQFSALMVQTLNIILLTASELSDLRSLLRFAWLPAASAASTGARSVDKRAQRSRLINESRSLALEESVLKPETEPTNGSSKEEAMNTFKIMFKAWSHNPVSALCLSLLAGAYGLAGSLVDILAESEVTVDLLVDADRLVKLLESPVFLHLRMQLLRSDVDFEPQLIKSLFGLLMILPQRSEAFKTLDARLSAVTGLHMALAGGRQGAFGPNRMDKHLDDKDSHNFDELLDDFAQIQALHARSRSEQFRLRSLVSS